MNLDRGMVESAAKPEFLEILTAAAQAQASNRPAASTVVEALLQAERTAKQQRHLYPSEALSGEWQLRFATGTRKLRQGGIALSKGYYLPRFVQGQIGFEPSPDATDRFQISNQLQVGAIRFRITGPAKYLNKKNLLAFDFTQMELAVFGRVLYRGGFRGGRMQADTFEQQPIAKLPFFSFFLITNDFIAARGRGGGLAIWVKSPV
ncbi:MAG: hypothetical protein EDM05_048210 [Leptolyngbya sp. IPPAS B-1204]